MNGFMFVSTTSTLLVDTTIILSWLPYIKNGGIVENSKLQRNESAWQHMFLHDYYHE